jgi:GntR family transcriptional regulator
MSASPQAAEASVTLYARIKDELRALIRDGTYKPLDQLPSESDMTARFGVSRITVRQALGDLQNEGVIFKVQGKGSFVARPKTDQDLSRLQGFAEAMSDSGHVAKNRVLSFRKLAADAYVAGKLRLEEGTEVCQILRLRFVDSEPISVDISYVSAELGDRLKKADLATRDIFLIFEHDYGIKLGNAELSIEATTVADDVAGHLRLDAGAPILRIERTTFTAAGQPLDFEYLFYRGDAFRYHLNIARQPARQ